MRAKDWGAGEKRERERKARSVLLSATLCHNARAP